MSTDTYQCWHVDVPQEYIEAETGFEARKIFARKHRKQVSECMARRRLEDPRAGRRGTERGASAE